MDQHHGERTTDVLDPVVAHVWAGDPDRAIESGQLPPVPWEDPRPAATAAHRRLGIDLVSSIRAASTNSDQHADADLAEYHLRSTDAIRPPGLRSLNHMTGPIARLFWGAHDWPVPLDPDCGLYADRLRAFGDYVDRLIAVAAEESTTAEGPSACAPVLRAFAAQADSALTSSSLAELLGPAERARRLDADPVPLDDLLPDVADALARLAGFSRRVLAGASEHSALAGGQEGARLYREAVFGGTSLDLDPVDIEDLGRRLLATTDAAYSELAPLAADVVPLGPEQLLARFADAHAQLSAALPMLFMERPAARCQVVAMPDAAAAVGPPAFYGPSSTAAGRPGSLMVNLHPGCAAAPWEVMPLAAHEGVPGHHLQLALLDEDAALDPVRRLLRVNATVEGWAVYSETLVPRTGLPLADTDRLGLLSHQRWRAARLVADVGLHVHGWPVERATSFIAEACGQPTANLRREVVRYLAWPGQALGYAIGAVSIAGLVQDLVDGGATLAQAHRTAIRADVLPGLPSLSDRL